LKVNISLTHEERSLFNQELNQHISLIESSLIELEQAYSKELIEQLFRSFHTIKGNAGMIGYTPMQQAAAETENILQFFRQNEINIEENTSKTLFEVLDYVKLLAALLNKPNFEIDEPAYNEIIALIKSTNNTENKKDSSEETTQKNKKDKESNKDKSKGTTLKISLVDDAEMPAVTFYQIIHTAEQHSEEFVSTPSSADIKEGISADILTITLPTSFSNDNLNKMLDELSIIDDIKFIKKIFSVKARDKGKRSLETRVMKNTKEELSEVQVNINELDDLINQLGEIMIDRNKIVDAISNLEKRLPLDKDIEKLSEASAHLWASSYRLQSQLLNIRAIPLRNIVDKYNRLAREIAKNINKKIKLEVKGQELRLDRIILNYLNDILIHLIRNSIDHGIELPGDRKKSGKELTGTIKIIAEQKSNKAVFQVSDDGKGIDAEVIRKKIIEKEIASIEDANEMSDEQVIEHIFHSGFSTKENVSDISGRGVGMDVVKNTIQKLGGGITVSSKKEVGTTFKITLPLTLAIIKGLIIDIDEKIFIIPITYIEEVIDISDYEIKKINEHPHIMYRDDVVPILHLKEILFGEKTKNSSHTKGIVLSFSDKIITLVVDKIIDEQEIVIKNIDFVDQLYYLIHSATILGTGDIGLILDVSALFDEIKRKYNLH